MSATATLNGHSLEAPIYCVQSNPQKPKRSYETKEIAEQAALYFEKRFPDQSTQHPYKCIYGDHFHLTTRPADECYLATAPNPNPQSVLGKPAITVLIGRGRPSPYLDRLPEIERLYRERVSMGDIAQRT